VCVCVWVCVGVCVCMYSCFIYPTRKAHFFCTALYCHLLPVWLFHIFLHYLIKGTIFGGKKLLHIKFVFWSFLQRLYEVFLVLIISQRGIIIHVHTSCYKLSVIFVRFYEPWIFSTDLRKLFIYQIENPSSGSRVVPFGQTDRQTNGQIQQSQQLLSAILRTHLQTVTVCNAFCICHSQQCRNFIAWTSTVLE